MPRGAGAGPLPALLAAAAAVAVAGACSVSPPPGETPGAAGLWERDVYPFAVLDRQGVPYDHPFLGGYNLPRPQLVDIDADGLPDLFVQEGAGRVAYFEAVGPRDPETGLPRWEWRTDRFAGIDVGEWFRFADMTGDGRPDLLTETRYSHISFWRNEGGSPGRVPTFRLVTDSLRDTDGEAIFSDRQNIPNIGDIDCDDALDLLIGRLVGTITHYEEAGRDEDGVPVFRHVTDRFENIEIIGQLLGSLHGANTLALEDIDGDGDPDLFWGDFFEPGLLFIENRGGCGRPSFTGAPVPFPPEEPLRTSGYNAPTFADLTGDGRLDLLVGVIGGAFNPATTAVENLYFLEQVEDGRFVERTRRFLRTVDVGAESIPAAVDLDGDGRTDVVLANKMEPGEPETSRLHLFRNVVGPGGETELREAGTLEIAGGYHLAPAFGDLTGNGLPDLLLGSWRDRIAYYRNEGTAAEPEFALVDSALVTITRGSHTRPALVDVDGDGRLDLFIGESSGAVNYYRNVGSRTEPRFELVTDDVPGLDVGRRSAPAFADLTGDGRPELLLGTEADGVALFRMEPTGEVPRFVRDAAFDLPDAPGLAAPAAADLTGDGRLEILVGGVGGGLVYYRRVP